MYEIHEYIFIGIIVFALSIIGFIITMNNRLSTWWNKFYYVDVIFNCEYKKVVAFMYGFIKMYNKTEIDVVYVKLFMIFT